jgi:hypothetical protein
LFQADAVANGMEVGPNSQGSPLRRSPSHGSIPLPKPNVGVIADGVPLKLASIHAVIVAYITEDRHTAREECQGSQASNSWSSKRFGPLFEGSFAVLPGFGDK